MQRLRQNNSGAALPLDNDEILAAPIGPAAAFESAWRLLASQFPVSRGDNRAFPELKW